MTKKTLILYFFMFCFLPVDSFGQTQAKKDDGGNAKTINGIECVLVKAGTFNMGSSTNENRDYDEIQHQVTLTNDFWISKYPITNEQYGKSAFGKENHPVVNVSWAEANGWAKNKGARLPTEAQWEFAARGGNKSKGYIYSGSDNLAEVGWNNGNSGRKTHPVGQKQPNELGIYDMSGNVWEWCYDLYGSYRTGAITDPAGADTGGSRVRRGGSWSGNADSCRVANRGNDPSYRYGDIGFRVVFPKE